MRQEGIIAAQVAVVSPEAVGRAVTIIVGLSTSDERTEPSQATKRVLAAAPEVQQCYYVTGDFDFIVVLTVESMAEYEALTQRVFLAHANITKFKTFVVMDRVKATLECPV
jgi:DNA-binding Lrp family transcriptional regulator